MDGWSNNGARALAVLGLAAALGGGCKRTATASAATASAATANAATASAATANAATASAATASAPEPTAPADSAQAKAFYGGGFSKRPTVAAMTALGRTLFAATALSGPGTLSCASCHDPAHAFAPANDRAVQLGGLAGTAVGLRAVPSLRYLQAVPRFSEHFQDSDGDGTDQGPAGGYTWDGRAATAHEQARLPLFSPLEMANSSPEALVARLRGSPYVAALRATFGDDVLDTPERGLKAVLMALEVFQQSPRDFAPYDSKYDAWLRGQAQLDAREQHGLALFEDPAKGNCVRCHPSRIKSGAFPAFTDYGFVALGVPRNRAIAANADPAWFDLGLCGPLRTDLAQRPGYCGMFRAPSLRNVARRRRFFHNGVVTSLRDAVRFYVERDRLPARWYPRGRGGQLQPFDDLPARYRGNLDVEAPFGARRGQGPALNDREIDDLVVFLGTLDDGWRAPGTGVPDLGR
jgi:cytochrome c peroxidase